MRQWWHVIPTCLTLLYRMSSFSHLFVHTVSEDTNLGEDLHLVGGLDRFLADLLPLLGRTAPLPAVSTSQVTRWEKELFKHQWKWYNKEMLFLRNKYFNALASGDLCRAFRNSLLTPGKLPWYSWKSFKVTARGLSLKPVKPLTLSRASCKALGILPLKTYSVAFCDGSSKESKSVRKHNASSKWVHNGRVQSKKTKQVLKTARRFQS